MVPLKSDDFGVSSVGSDGSGAVVKTFLAFAFAFAFCVCVAKKYFEKHTHT